MVKSDKGDCIENMFWIDEIYTWSKQSIFILFKLLIITNLKPKKE
jgi:hypothetical protein